MVTKTMPIEAPSGQTGTVNDRSAGRNNAPGSGFSDVLGNVGGGAERGRRQPGMAGSSMRGNADGGTSSFEYTRKAAESVQDDKNVQFAFSQPGQRVFTVGNGNVFDESAADKILAEAAEIVKQTVGETGETPDMSKTAAMLTDALTQLKPEDRETAAKAEDTAPGTQTAAELPKDNADELIDALINAVNKVSRSSAEAIPEEEAVVTENADADTEDISGQRIQVRTEAVSETSERVTEDAGNAADLVTVNSDDAADLVTENAGETADPGTYIPAEEMMQENGTVTKGDDSERPEPARKNADTVKRGEVPERPQKPVMRRLDVRQPVLTDAEMAEMPEMPESDIAAVFMAGQDAAGAQMYVGSSADAENTDVRDLSVQIDLPKGYSVVREMFAAPERGLPISTSDLTETDILPEEDMPTDAVNETFRMLTQLIKDAKKELGLTEVRIEYTEGEQPEEMLPIMPDDHVRLSRQLNGSDRTNELDHILGAGRTDAPEDGAPKTQTYDAVRMFEQLMGSRTDAALRQTAEVEFRDEAQTIARPPEVQLTEQILSRLDEMQTQQRDHTEFTMVLNPESLGRITVKLVMTGEKTAVEINAENPDTRALLASRSETLQNMLRDNGVQLERYQVVSERDDAAFERQSYEGSSKNPYSRNDDGKQKSDDDSDSGNFYDLLQSI